MMNEKIKIEFSKAKIKLKISSRKSNFTTVFGLIVPDEG